MTEKISKTLDKANVWMPHIMAFLIRLSAKILLYITVIFMLTGIYKFQPETLIQFLNFDIDTFENQDITLQEAWLIIFPIVMAVDIIYESCRTVILNKSLINLIIMPVVIIIGYSTVSTTGFVGDRMLATYLLWGVIQAICRWSLAKMIIKTITIHKAGSMGTAVCLQKENEMHGRTKT